MGIWQLADHLQDLVIVQADLQKNSFIAAYNIKTGKQVWKTPREEISVWSTPTVYEGKTRAELITNGTKAIRGYDPLTGKELVATDTELRGHHAHAVCRARSDLCDQRLSPDSTDLCDPARRRTGDITLKDGKDKSEFIAWSKTARWAIHADANRLRRHFLHSVRTRAC